MQVLENSLSLLSEETFKRMEKESDVNEKRQLNATKLEGVGGKL